jgi:hypothetical protein
MVSLADLPFVSFRGCVSMYHSREMNIYCISYVSHNVGAWVCSKAGKICSAQYRSFLSGRKREILRIRLVIILGDVFSVIVRGK